MLLLYSTESPSAVISYSPAAMHLQLFIDQSMSPALVYRLHACVHKYGHKDSLISFSVCESAGRIYVSSLKGCQLCP